MPAERQPGAITMKNDDIRCKIQLCPEPEIPRPINLPVDAPPDNNGFLIVRFKTGTLDTRHGDLAAAAEQAGMPALVELLEAFGLPSRPLITSIKPDELAK